MSNSDDDSKYLAEVLKAQYFKEGDKELEELRAQRDKVEGILKEAFKGENPTIRYGGSKPKGTMLKEAYDLDLLCYLPNGGAPSKTLEDIYNTAKNALATQYHVREKTSAIRISDKTSQLDFHVDVVPGRFTSDDKEEVFLHQTTGKKERLKTNPDLHIRHVRDSGVVDAVSLVKLWRIRNVLEVRNFVLELAVIDVLKDHKSKSLADQVSVFLGRLAAEIDTIKVEDPANPTGNDLSTLFNTAVKAELTSVAQKTLKAIKDRGWRAVFGEPGVMDKDTKDAAVGRAVVAAPVQAKPWARR